MWAGSSFPWSGLLSDVFFFRLRPACVRILLLRRLTNSRGSVQLAVSLISLFISTVPASALKYHSRWLWSFSYIVGIFNSIIRVLPCCCPPLPFRHSPSVRGRQPRTTNKTRNLSRNFLSLLLILPSHRPPEPQPSSNWPPAERKSREGNRRKAKGERRQKGQNEVWIKGNWRLSRSHVFHSRLCVVQHHWCSRQLQSDHQLWPGRWLSSVSPNHLSLLHAISLFPWR